MSRGDQGNDNKSSACHGHSFRPFTSASMPQVLALSSKWEQLLSLRAVVESGTQQTQACPCEDHAVRETHE